jgi:hypothetical protein
MIDAVSKVIGIVIAFIMLVIAPTVIMRVTDDAATKRLVLNSMNVFIDKVTDKGSITKQDLDTLFAEVNSHGIPFDVQVFKYEKMSVPDAYTRYSTVYVNKYGPVVLFNINPTVPYTNESVEFLKVGDVIQVRVNAMTPSQGQLLAFTWLKQSEPLFEFTLAGSVR